MSEGLTVFLAAVADTMRTICWQPQWLTLADDGQWVEADMDGHCAMPGIEVVDIRNIFWEGAMRIGLPLEAQALLRYQPAEDWG